MVEDKKDWIEKGDALGRIHGIDGVREEADEGLVEDKKGSI